MQWVDPSIPGWKTRASVTCTWKGTWKVNNEFRCLNPCPTLTNLNKKRYVKVRHEWHGGFQMIIKLTPKVDLNDWTVVLYFPDEAPGVNLQYYTWETQLTVSANGRIATMTSMPWNIGIKKGESYSFLLVVTGASRTRSLPKYLVKYTGGIHEDMSCLLEDHYDTTTVGLTTTKSTTVTTTTAPVEDPDFCENEKDGKYPHPDCSKYYLCSKGATSIES